MPTPPKSSKWAVVYTTLESKKIKSLIFSSYSDALKEWDKAPRSESQPRGRVYLINDRNAAVAGDYVSELPYTPPDPYAI
jgi:hypothetical protein